MEIIVGKVARRERRKTIIRPKKQSEWKNGRLEKRVYISPVARVNSLCDCRMTISRHLAATDRAPAAVDGRASAKQCSRSFVFSSPSLRVSPLPSHPPHSNHPSLPRPFRSFSLPPSASPLSFHALHTAVDGLFLIVPLSVFNR